jgi:uncharacterized membrane protein (UPF0136 family)
MKMDLLPIFQWAEATAVGEWIRGGTWPFPLIETFHILALAVFLGALFLIDLRLLGLKIGGISAAAMSRQLNVYINWGIVVILVSGFMLFASEGGKLYENSAFMPKMYFLLAALVSHYTLHKWAVASDNPPAWAPLAGALSLILWFATGMAGRAIGFV